MSISDLGDLRRHLGIDYEFGTDEHGSYLRCSMNAYAENMTTDFVQEFGSIRDTKTPGPPGAPPTRSSTEDEILHMERFRSFVGRLMFAAGKTDPSICNACRELSSHLTAPNAEHWKRLSHLMGYIQTETLQGYKLRPPTSRRVVAFVDSDYGSDKDDRKVLPASL